MFERHRFKTDPEDSRPVAFPPPGPYWCTGSTGAHAIVVAYLPKGEPLLKWWPDAVDVETDVREVIQFTDRFVCPAWWSAPDSRAIKPTTLEGLKRLAKNLKRLGDGKAWIISTAQLTPSSASGEASPSAPAACA